MSNSAAGGGGVWAFPAAPLALAPFRRFHCTASVKNKLYVFGGETKIKPPNEVLDQTPVKRMLADLICYDIVTDEWSVLCPGSSAGPARRKGAVLVAHNDTSLFLFGGAGPGVILNDLWEFSLREQRWIDRSRQVVMSLLERLPQQCPTTRETMRLTEETYKLSDAFAHERPDLYPLPRAYHTAVIYHNKLIMYGGHGVKMASSNLWQFDLEKGHWQSIPMTPLTPSADASAAAAGEPGCRFGLVSCVFERGMYISGGQLNSKLVNPNLWRLDLNSFIWQQVTTAGPPPTPRTYGTSCLIGNRWFIHGGSSADDVFADAHELDLSTLRWHPANVLNTLVTLEGHHAACAPTPWGGTSILLFGGATSGPLVPEGPLLRCDFFLPSEGGGIEKLDQARLEDFAIRPVAAADLIWKLSRTGHRIEQQVQARQRIEKEMSETVDTLRLRHDELSERHEMLLKEKSMLETRAANLASAGDSARVREMQMKVEELQTQLSRHTSAELNAKQNGALQVKYEEVLRREQLTVERICVTTQQLRGTRQRIRDELEFPLSRLTEDLAEELPLGDLVEASLAAAEQVSEDVAAAIASLKTLAAGGEGNSVSPLSSARASRRRPVARATSVLQQPEKRRLVKEDETRSKSISAESSPAPPPSYLRNKSVPKPVAAAVSRRLAPRQSSPGLETNSSVETTSALHQAAAERQMDELVVQPSESVRDGGSVHQHMSSPLQTAAPKIRGGVNRGVSVSRVNRVEKGSPPGGGGAHADSSKSLTKKSSEPPPSVSPQGINRSTQCGSGILKLKSTQNVENGKVSSRSLVGISKGIGADT